MSIKQFKMISPGVMWNETDNSQLPKLENKIGPVIIGRTERGPSMVPVKVDSFSEFVEIFGNPIGGGKGTDVFREGNYTAPTYAGFAAQAWLRNNGPATIVRLLGNAHENATTDGAAGFTTTDADGVANGLGTQDSNGGAYGLFLIDKGRDSYGVYSSTGTTGSLAAIFYINEGAIVLSGAARTGSASGSAQLIKSVGSDQEFRALIYDKNHNVVKTTTFNFNINSSKYIRKVFNTNPILTNTDVSTGANTASYWLGETYDRHVGTYVSGGLGEVYGTMLGLRTGSGASAIEGSNFKMSAQAAQTGWYFCQDLQSVTGAANSYQPENMTKLFKFHCLNTGDNTQKMVKISIQDIKLSSNSANPYGSFTVLLRHASDRDNAVEVIESFADCNLNPNSENYIAKKIGDRYMTWDDSERRYREYGNYDNNSKFIRIEMNSDVDAGATNAALLPFGVYGPPRYKGFTLIGGENYPQVFGQAGGNDFLNSFVVGGTSIVRSNAPGSEFVGVGAASASFTGSFLFPALALRSSSLDGNLANPQDAYFGIDTMTTRGGTRKDDGYIDYLRPRPYGVSSFVADNNATEYSWIFTLDDLIANGVHVNYSSGSRAAGTSITAQHAYNYRRILDLGFNRFTSPLFGGFDGLDITEKEPFCNRVLEDGTEITNYAFNSIKRAIDCVSDREVVECNLMTMPGLTNETLTSHIITVCEDRGDALAIIDLKGGFVPSTENTNGDSSAANRGDVDTVISNLKNRGINSSYGAAYFPFVQIRDSIGGSTLWAPPSIVALGTIGSSESKSEIWFAPAGFNRGGLTEGSAGIPVVGVREKLSVKQRDALYLANINSIASFPNEGLVIFGQKTLQTTKSALDRVNVRRMLIELKVEISRMAKTILFDQNTKITWNRFLSKILPYLRSVQTRMGLKDFKVILDETTTTPELIDRNIMYAKIFLVPLYSIEFIAIEFNISSTGASFVD